MNYVGKSLQCCTGDRERWGIGLAEFMTLGEITLIVSGAMAEV